MKLSRRSFFKALGGTALSAQLPLFSPFAHAGSTGDYKALVCIFLYGGNDANNLIVPMDSGIYDQYLSIRGPLSAGGIGLDYNSLVPLSAGGTAHYGLHPDLAPLQGIWDAGDLAPVFNVGTLVAPLTKTQYQNGTGPIPASLLSHSDQQAQWQTAYAQGNARSGWGGRIADVIDAANGTSVLPTMMSFAGTDIYTLGNIEAPLALSDSGAFQLNSFAGGYADAVNSAVKSLLSASNSNLLMQGQQKILGNAIAATQLLNPILTGSSAICDPLFSGLGTDIAQQLYQVAKVIENRAALGVQRQVFYVSLGGFDTHTDLIGTQSRLFQQLAPALRAFYDATTQLGVADSVTSFTMSDFGRTLEPASGAGSDHAWGSHHLVFGGAVKGQATYGQFPELTLGGPDDASDEGRWLPSTSVDQYAATLASWFGVSGGDLATVLPNIGNFSTKNLGFMG